MPQPPITFLESQWAGGWNNSLIPAATPSDQLAPTPMLDLDVNRMVTPMGRRYLMSLGRREYVSCLQITNAVDELARFSVSTFLPQFGGQNSDWGELAESYFEQSDKFIDIRGFPFSMDTCRSNLVKAIIRDGDFGIIKATDKTTGEPRIQCIPSHRIGARFADINSIVQGGDYDGMRLIDGVIVNDYGRAVAYRVYGENSYDQGNYQEIPANYMSLAFIPDYPEQVRGISRLGRASISLQRVADSREAELIAQQIAASYTMAIYNETGRADKSKAVLAGPSVAADTSGAAQSLPTQVVKPGMISYLRAGRGDKIESISSDRPSANVMAFQDEVHRGPFASIGSSFDFSHNLSKVGGAPMRVVIEKMNASIFEIQNLGVAPILSSIYGWRAAVAIGNKRLPDEKEWYAWRFQGPPEITADEKYTSDVAMQDVHNCFKSKKRVTGQFGGGWKRVQDDNIEVEARLNEKCKAKGVDPDKINWPGPNGAPPEQPQGATKYNSNKE